MKVGFPELSNPPYPIAVGETITVESVAGDRFENAVVEEVYEGISFMLSFREGYNCRNLWIRDLASLTVLGRDKEEKEDELPYRYLVLPNI